VTGSDKTEKPTPKRIQDAREQGQVVRSQEFTSALLLGLGSILLATGGAFWGNSLMEVMRHILSQMTRTAPLTQNQWLVTLQETGQVMFGLIVPIGLVLMIAGTGGHLAVTGLLFTTKPLVPALNKLNPLSGVQRLFSKDKLVELGKSLMKMALIASLVYGVVENGTRQLPTWYQLPLNQVLLQGLWPMVTSLMIWASAGFLLVGILDWAWNGWQYQKKLMMSRQEIIDERKNQDGDPKMKARQRRMGRQLVEKRQLASVPKADVVINNPTHFSVAIQYDPDLGPAPRVIAKGQDFFALKIRETAKEHGVPMVENKPLARSLYATVEVDQMIPPELFVAVAEVLAYVYAKNKGRKR
jgi:flagellar biosynthesis protein FlhB